MGDKELKYVYISETHEIWQEYGEVHISNDTHHIVWNADSLFHDLDGLMYFATNARKSDEERVIGAIKKQIEKYEKRENNSGSKNS